MAVLSAIALGCSVRNNTAATRFYHNLTTRYNVYHNGDNAFEEAYRKQLLEAPDNLAERIHLEPVFSSNPNPSKEPGGPFDAAIEKGQKAIRLHSIRSKPKQRNRARRNDPFYRKKEYNSFIHNAWLLVGKSQFNNGDFLDAMATFSYMARLFRDDAKIHNVARLWQARCYIALRWPDDAGRLMGEIRSDSQVVTSGLYGKVFAEQAILEGRTSDAIPLLRQAIRKERNGLAKIRLYFLKGQIELENNLLNESRKSFRRVVASAAPFSIEVSARLNIITIDAQNKPKDAIKSLDRMLKKEKFESVADKVALAKGRILLSQSDTVKALEAFALGRDKSTQKGFEYALCCIESAQIYLAQQEYVRAAKVLSLGISALDEKYPDYATLKKLSENLDELSRFALVVQQQDSLRHLAALPEPERLRIIDSAITAYKDRLKQEAREAIMEEQKAQQEAFNAEMDQGQRMRPSIDQTEQVSDKSFYFYNPELIELGKNTFAREWGNRVLEDNWRRKNKRLDIGAQSNLSSAESEDSETSTENSATTEEEDASYDKNSEETDEKSELDESQDPEKRAYYLASLPFTPEAVEASDKLIRSGFEGMGTVLSERMEYFREAIDTYSELLDRYPDYEGRFQVYYKLFMLCKRLNDHDGANHWKNMMQSQFPSEALSKAVANPNYIQSLRLQDSIENTLYDKALAAYFGGDANSTLEFTSDLLQKYSQSALRPKALFLQGLAYVSMGNSEELTKSLQMILDESPSSDVAELAEPILSDLSRGRKIVKDGYKGIDFEYLFFEPSDSLASDSLYFSKPQFGEKYLTLLFYPEEGVEVNELLFSIAAFNFSAFTDYNLSISHQTGEGQGLITISGLPSLRVARDFLRLAYSPKGFMPLLQEVGWMLPISEPNHRALSLGLSLGEYINYLADSLIVFIPEASIPLETIANLAESGEELKEESVSPKDITTDADSLPSSQDIKHLQPDTIPLLRPEPGDSLRLKPEDTQKVDTIAIPTDTLKATAESEPPAEVTIQDVEQLREQRIITERERQKQEKIRKKEAERERQKALREREKARREQEQLRAKEQRERQKARKKAQQEKERKRREAERARRKNKR